MEGVEGVTRDDDVYEARDRDREGLRVGFGARYRDKEE